MKKLLKYFLILGLVLITGLISFSVYITNSKYNEFNNFNNLLQSMINEKPLIYIEISGDVSDSVINTFRQKIIDNFTYVDEVSLVTIDTQVQLFKERHADDERVLSELKNEDTNDLFKTRLELYTNDLDEVLEIKVKEFETLVQELALEEEVIMHNIYFYRVEIIQDKFKPSRLSYLSGWYNHKLALHSFFLKYAE